MKEQFCTYQISLKLKELGFNEECFACFYPWSNSDQEFQLPPNRNANKFNKEFINAKAINGCAAPLWQQAISFLKSKGVLVTERWDGWEYGAEEWDEFIFCESKEETILKAIKIIS